VKSRGLFPFAFLQWRLGPISTIKSLFSYYLTTVIKYVSARPTDFSGIDSASGEASLLPGIAVCPAASVIPAPH
jgi:hypothetical protein